MYYMFRYIYNNNTSGPAENFDHMTEAKDLPAIKDLSQSSPTLLYFVF